MTTSVDTALLDPDDLLRLADPSEYGAYGEMLDDAFTTGCWVTEEYRAGLHQIARRAKSSFVWVVEQLSSHELVAGILTPHPDEIRGGISTFNILGVATAGRGLGLGHKLVEHAIAQARYNGAESLSINSSPHMTHAHRLYYQHGFVRRIERETKVVDRGQRLFSFELRLTPPTDGTQGQPPDSGHGPTPVAPVHRAPEPSSTPLQRRIMTSLPLAMDPDVTGPNSLAETIFESPDVLTLGLNPTIPEHLSIRILVRLLGLSEDIAVGHSSGPYVAVGSDNGVPKDATPKHVIESLLTAANEGNANAAWLKAPTSGPAAQRLVLAIDDDLITAERRIKSSDSEAEREALARLIYARLGVLDNALQNPDSYLMGQRSSLIDLQLFAFLALFDITVRDGFEWGAASVRDYPYLWRYARKLAQKDGFLTAEDRRWIGLSTAPNIAGISASSDLVEAWDIPFHILEPIDRALG